MHAVIAQQVGIGFHRSEVVDGDNLDVLAVGFGDGAQDIAADAAESVNGNAYCHKSRSRLVQSAAARCTTTHIVISYIFPSLVSAACATASAVIPNFLYSSLYGALAPNEVMPIKMPSEPMMASQP